MKYPAALSLLAVLAAFSFSAKLQAQYLNPMSLGCPVSFRAQHSADGSMVAVRQQRPNADAQQKGPSQYLRLVVTNPRWGQVTGATLILRGFSGKGRMSQATQRDEYDAVTTQQVDFSPGPAKEVSADLFVPGMTSVQLVQITSLTFADGSTWKLNACGSCRVAPEMLMRIASR